MRQECQPCKPYQCWINGTNVNSSFEFYGKRKIVENLQPDIEYQIECVELQGNRSLVYGCTEFNLTTVIGEYYSPLTFLHSAVHIQYIAILETIQSLEHSNKIMQ